MPATYTLDPDAEALARRLVESGRYASVAEVINDGIHRVADQEQAMTGEQLDELRRLVGEGQASRLMTAEETEAFFNGLEAKYAAMAARMPAR